MIRSRTRVVQRHPGATGENQFRGSVKRHLIVSVEAGAGALRTQRLPGQPDPDQLPPEHPDPDQLPP
jgi:hypothetical protein